MRFSIVVPAYNAARFLDRCIASVQAQRFDDWELIVTDDGSTDGSGELLARYAAAERRMTVLAQDNCGQFFARQRGIERASGEYLLFLDSDDELAPDCLTSLDAAIGAYKPDMLLFTGGVFEDGRDTGRTIGRISPEPMQISAAWLRSSLISSNALNSLCIKAFRRELFEGDEADYSRFCGTHCGEDKARLLYPVTKARRIYYIPDRLYRYYHHADSTVHGMSIKTAERMLACGMFSMLGEYMQKWGMTDEASLEAAAQYYVKNFLSVYFGVRRSCRTAGDKREFRRFPWKRYMDKRAFNRRVVKKLCAKDRLRLPAAVLKL